MGAWGCGVSQDDVACDVLLTFTDLMEANPDKAALEAIQAILADPPWGWDDQDDSVVQILALAALALQHRALEPTLRDTAIALIDSGQPLDRWEESSLEQIAARLDVLERFKALLIRGSARTDELASVTTP